MRNCLLPVIYGPFRNGVKNIVSLLFDISDACKAPCLVNGAFTTAHYRSLDSIFIQIFILQALTPGDKIFIVVGFKLSVLLVLRRSPVRLGVTDCVTEFYWALKSATVL